MNVSTLIQVATLMLLILPNRRVEAGPQRKRNLRPQLFSSTRLTTFTPSTSVFTAQTATTPPFTIPTSAATVSFSASSNAPSSISTFASTQQFSTSVQSTTLQRTTVGPVQPPRPPLYPLPTGQGPLAGSTLRTIPQCPGNLSPFYPFRSHRPLQCSPRSWYVCPPHSNCTPSTVQGYSVCCYAPGYRPRLTGQPTEQEKQRGQSTSFAANPYWRALNDFVVIREEILRRNDEFANLVRLGNFPAIVTDQYAEDATLLMPGRVSRGRQAILETMMARRPKSITRSSSEISGPPGGNDWVAELAQDLTINADDTQTVSNVLVVWKRIESRWQKAYESVTP